MTGGVSARAGSGVSGAAGKRPLRYDGMAQGWQVGSVAGGPGEGEVRATGERG